MAPLRVMGTGVLQRPSDDAANPRGAKVPTGRRPCKEKHRRYARSERAVATDLTRMGDKARQEPTLVFTTLYHHITDVDNLRACYDRLPAHKASGVDGVTKAEYGEHLEEHLRDLSARLKRQGYRPAPKRRTYVPKAGSAKGRPLGIELDPIRWTSFQRGIRWPPWQTARRGGRGGASRTPTRPARCAWSSMRARRSRPRRAIWG